jgi:TetR/AcrR family transcriptional regulator
VTETVLTFQRARKPEEQQLRREAILAAAAELFDAEGPQGAGLNAIAAKAGFTKSNLYRYFESREDVLLSLFLDEIDGFASDIEASLSDLDGGVKKIARVLARTFEAHPRFGALSSILTSVLEQNVSEETVINLKRTMVKQVTRIGKAIQGQLPKASLEDCIWVASMLGTIVAGLWPSAHPGTVPAQVLTRPEFAHLKPTIERDLERVGRALLKSIVD